MPDSSKKKEKNDKKFQDKNASKSTTTSSWTGLSITRAIVILIISLVAGYVLGIVSRSDDLTEYFTNLIRSARLKVSEKTSSSISESQSESSSSASAHIPVSASFRNTHDEDIRLYWKNHQGKEQELAYLKPGQSQNFNTFVRQSWILRIAESGKYIKEVTIGKNTQRVDSKLQSEFHRKYEETNGFPWINGMRDPLDSYIPDPVEIGHKVTLQLSPAHFIKDQPQPALDSVVELVMETKQLRPKIFYIEDFVSEDECDHFKELVKSGKYNMKRSGVKDTGEIIDTRTSTNCWVDCDEDPVVEGVARRAFHLLKKDYDPKTYKEISESFQLVHYDVKQEYQEHYDYFDISVYPDNEHLQQGNNRYATVFIYLEDVEEGGETMFPRAGGQYVGQACANAKGYRVSPKKGAVTIFFSMLPDGNLDFDSLHGGCPVRTGEKWASNLWFWDKSRGKL